MFLYTCNTIVVWNPCIHTVLPVLVYISPLLHFRYVFFLCSGFTSHMMSKNSPSILIWWFFCIFLFVNILRGLKIGLPTLWLTTMHPLWVCKIVLVYHPHKSFHLIFHVSFLLSSLLHVVTPFVVIFWGSMGSALP